MIKAFVQLSLFISTIVLFMGASLKKDESGGIYEVLTNWRYDTIGNKYRNEQNCKLLIHDLCLMDKNLEEIIELLGYPNKLIYDDQNNLNEIYFYCETNNIITIDGKADGTYCEAVFVRKEKGDGLDFFYICT